jgi:hypothetical protein
MNCLTQCEIRFVLFRCLTVIKILRIPSTFFVGSIQSTHWLRPKDYINNGSFVGRIFLSLQRLDCSLTSITKLWKPWTYQLTSTSCVPILNSHLKDLHSMKISSPHTIRVRNKLKTREQMSYITFQESVRLSPGPFLALYGS